MSDLNSVPSVAVLLAAYNAGDFLEEQIKSILNQRNVLVDIYISVDLSTDDTYEYCKSLQSEYENVYVLSYGERFGGAAKNFFRLIKDVDFSKYEFVSFSDHDDIWLDNKLSRACDLIRINKLDAYSSDVIAFWEDGRKQLIKKSYPQKEFDYLFEAAGPGCSYVLTCVALQEFKDFMIKSWQRINQIALHDWMIYAYCRTNRMQWYIDDLPLMEYRQHASNQVGSNSGFQAYLKRISMVKDQWYRKEVKKVADLTRSEELKGFSFKRRALIMNFWKLRRRTRDSYALLVMLIFGVF